MERSSSGQQQGVPGWKITREMGVDPDADEAMMESLTAKVHEKILEFEKERSAYIETMRQELQPSGEGDKEAQRREGEGRGEREENRRCGIIMSRGRSLASLRAAREERWALGEEIRVLQQRKADAAVRLQGERLSNLEQSLELGALRLERLLDRERILELLRLTDPNRPPAPLPQAETNAAFRGGDDDAGEEKVSLQLVAELEDRVAEAEERVRTEASKLGMEIAVRLGERSQREEQSRHEGRIVRDDVLRLQEVLKDKEVRLSRTVIDYLELRHAVLRAQRISTEARAEAEVFRMTQAEEVEKCKADLAEQRRHTKETVERACEALGGQLRRQIQLREEEAFMLAEQHAEAEQLYEARGARLQSLLDDWKSKYGALRRRFALETEGFRRDADEIGRRFERIRAGPPGGRRPISSRSGSSARLAVERAIDRQNFAGHGTQPRRGYVPEEFSGYDPKGRS